ncbi:MAG: hypothetical protein GTO18_12840, partial [Anaerolineales bacterium]|nr:hypothetical protein [Anaerolineales bacterium]
MNAKADRNLKVKMLALVLVFTLSILSPLGTMTSEAATFVSATISVNPDRGLVGTTVTVNGSGFTGGFPAAIFWDKVQMVTFTMPKGGSFSMSFKVPAQASPGGHTISVCSNCGGGEFEERAATGFKVTEPPVVPPNPSPTKEPPPTNPTT